MVQEIIERFGALDIVINNATIIANKTMRKMTYEKWQAVIDTNLTGVFNVCRESVDRIFYGGRIADLGYGSI